MMEGITRYVCLPFPLTRRLTRECVAWLQRSGTRWYHVVVRTCEHMARRLGMRHSTRSGCWDEYAHGPPPEPEHTVEKKDTRCFMVVGPWGRGQDGLAGYLTLKHGLTPPARPRPDTRSPSRPTARACVACTRRRASPPRCSAAT